MQVVAMVIRNVMMHPMKSVVHLGIPMDDIVQQIGFNVIILFVLIQIGFVMEVDEFLKSIRFYFCSIVFL